MESILSRRGWRETWKGSSQASSSLHLDQGFPFLDPYTRTYVHGEAHNDKSLAAINFGTNSIFRNKYDSLLAERKGEKASFPFFGSGEKYRKIQECELRKGY